MVRFVLLLAAFTFSAPAVAQVAPPITREAGGEPVDLELALGVDVSGSIDWEEAELQRRGYVDAFRHPQIIEAIQSGMLGRIAVTYYEWAGFGHMKVIADWTLVEDEATAHAFADKLAETRPRPASRTAISDAIDFAAGIFDGNGFDGQRRVIDLSGDGPNNHGELVTLARDRAVAQGITINGLPIVNDRPSPSGRPPLKDLDLYYRDCVIGGPRAFMVVANDFIDFARAVRRKLFLEIAGLMPEPHLEPVLMPAQLQQQERIAPPCDIGEKLRQRWWQRDN